MAKSFGAHHEWDRLREVVIGLSPAEDFIVFHEESMRWQTPEAAEFSRSHAGEPLLGVDPEWAARMERQLDALAERVAREGVTVHRPERLQGPERTFLAPNGAGAQLFARDPMIVVGDHAIEGSLRIQCRQRERFGLRTHLQKAAIERGARWTSVPLGWLNGVDGPFLEGGDTLLNGREVYVGMSGCASDMAGVDWLQALLGAQYRVIPVALRSDVLHLDGALALIRPGLLVWCPDRLIDGLPMSLRDWETITVSKAESVRLATNLLVLDEGCVIADSDNARVIGELRQRRLDVIPMPFDGPIRLGGGLRSAHHPLWREGILE